MLLLEKLNCCIFMLIQGAMQRNWGLCRSICLSKIIVGVVSHKFKQLTMFMEWKKYGTLVINIEIISNI